MLTRNLRQTSTTSGHLGASLPEEPKEATELGLGVPKNELWLREDVNMRCNILMLGFVRKTLKKAHSTLVARLVEKAHLIEAQSQNGSLSVLNARRDSTLLGCGGGLRPGYRSGAYSDTSSLRSSCVSQSPHISHQFSTSLVSPSYQDIDPSYHDARGPYQNLPTVNAEKALSLQLQPQPANVMELPVEDPNHIFELPTIHHELPARFLDKYD